jgi:hypothetical protein
MPEQDGTGPKGNKPLGSIVCTCPKCGHEEAHQRSIPCANKKCPKCQTPMKGVNCL